MYVYVSRYTDTQADGSVKDSKKFKQLYLNNILGSNKKQKIAFVLLRHVKEI